jgi:cytochrome c oxidase cbb3-type subunit 3
MRCNLAPLLLVAAVSACQRVGQADLRANEQGPSARTQISAGDLAHAAGVDPGIHPQVVFGDVHNPYNGNAGAAAEGRELFVQYNCSGCHGGRAGGGMGPNLRDSAWIYGNSDAQLFGTIVEGRPNGMPTWGPKISSDQIWKIITYIRTLGTPQEPDAPPKIPPPPLAPSNG